MKKHLTFFIAVVALLSSVSLRAQTEKGKYVVGGSADLSMLFQGKNSTFNLSLAPQFGAFVVKGFAVGARYSFSVGSSKVYDFGKHRYTTTTTFSSAIGPQLRYYLGKKPLRGVFTFSANYLTTLTMKSTPGVGTSISGNSGFNLTGVVGAAYFFNPHISLETGLYVIGQDFMQQLPITRIGFTAGFFMFLDNKKKE